MNPTAYLTLAITLALAAPHGALAFQQLGSGWSAQQLPQLLPQQQPPAIPMDVFSGTSQQQTQPQFQQLQQAQLQQPQLQAPASPLDGRQPIAPDLQNQIQALSAQLAAANRQIQYYQQQLSMAGGASAAPQQQQFAPQQPQQQQPQIHQGPAQSLNQPIDLQLQQQLQQQQQLQAALAAQQQQLAIQQQQAQLQQPQLQQQQPAQTQPQFGQFAPQQAQLLQQAQQQPLAQAGPVSTLIDNQQTTDQLSSDPRLAGQPQFFQQQQQQQQHQQQQQQPAQIDSQRQWQSAGQQQQSAPTTSSSVEPASIEPSSAAQQSSAATANQQVPTSHAPVHGGNSAPNDDKFSIGLGVLSPGYTQKFGNTALDFNQDKNGYSFTLSNNGHSNQVPSQPTQKPATSAADVSTSV